MQTRDNTIIYIDHNSQYLINKSRVVHIVLEEKPKTIFTYALQYNTLVSSKRCVFTFIVYVNNFLAAIVYF